MNLVKLLKVENSSGITFIKSLKDEKFLSYRKLYENALNTLSFLQKSGLKENDKLIFQLEDNETFVTTFWACLIGKIIPIPLSVANSNANKLKLINIYEFLNKPFIISDINLNQKIDRELKVIQYENKKMESNPKISEIKESDIAFIQFSSGSTNEPKGVTLTHANLLHNLKSFSITANINQRDSFLSWFPLTHDMGLIGWHLVPLFNALNQTLISTNLFVRRPSIWLESATKFKSTILCSPNFGYRHFLKLFNSTKVNLNLSNVRLIFNGAEPISASLCDEFLEKLKPFGLKENTIYTVYGLAEATLAVAFPPPETKFQRYSLDLNHLSIGDRVIDVENGATYVDVGYPNFEVEIRIVNDEGVILNENFVGHIEIKSKSVMQGYFNNEELTNKIIKDNWLDSGDLGFLRDGRLIIVGRAKDVIIVNGVNYYPHDIERVAEEVEGCELNRVVACGVRDKTQENEELIIFVLFKRSENEFKTISENLKKYILKKLGLIVKEVIKVKKIPKTTSGKLQRFKLKESYIKGEFREKENLLNLLSNEIKELIDGEIDINKPLFEQGFNSINSIAFIEKISKKLNREINISTIFNYPTLKELALFLEDKTENLFEKEEENSKNIAIIGMGVKVANSSNIDEFWNLLMEGVDVVTKAPKDRFQNEFYGNFLSKVDKFDNEFFGISEAEAISLDPQQRILLETTQQALDYAGIDTNSLKGSKTGVFIGISNSDYAMKSLREIKNIDTYSLTGNLLSTASGRISYTFGLNGPSLSIDTACSSSLSAIHLACQSLKNSESSLAIAGGVNLILSNEINIALSKVDALSASGKCKSFDESADGYARGEGCGIVILKPLNKAIEDRDNILAVIKSSAINHDGKTNGLTAPNGLSQQKLIKEALNRANLKPNDISYIETHGTGTNLGDPIEANALAEIFTKPLLIGAIKSNIGHLEASAGVMSLIKVALSLKNGVIPPNLHFKKLNPHIKTSNLTIVNEKTPWKNINRYAGVNSFGFSGTNVHLILSESPKIEEVKENQFKIFFFSAKDIASLEKILYQFKKFLNQTKDSLTNIAYSTSTKTHYRYRVGFVISNKNELIESIKNYLKAKVDEYCFIKSKKEINLPIELKEKEDFIDLAMSYANGENLNFSKYLSGKKVPLPTYPFNRKSFWINEIKRENSNVIESLKSMISKINSSQNFNINSNLIENGFDSLSLIQLKNLIQKEFNLNIEIKEFFLTLNTLSSLAKYIEEEIKVKKVERPQLNYSTSNSNSIEDIFKKQIDSMNELFNRQNEILKGTNVTKNLTFKKSNDNIKYSSLKQIKISDDELSIEKQEFINQFIEKFNIKMKNSKNFTIENKKSLADWIHTIAFRKSLKEVIYPIVAKSAKGSKIVDIDDNEYIDISMGYGSNFFGHNMDFINEAIEEELQKGFVLAPQTPLVKDVISLIKEFTKVERVCFSNTGSEAVMASLRIARAVSKKDKIIKFKGSFHGTFDGVLGTSENGVIHPSSLGVMDGMIEDIIEFNYGSEEVFEYIENNYENIAGVLIEPIQSRRPEFAPIEFLKKLRKITKKFDIAYILDEMITGFRVAKGGVQEVFDISADIVLYGKAIANSMPIGIIAGSAKYLDMIDGGFFNFGDESVPSEEMITFGGTFCKHPLTLASIYAGLSKMKESDFQEEVNDKTKRFASEINEFFKDENISIKVNHFGSLFKFESFGKYALALNQIEMDLFFYLLLYKGVYTWEKRICFMSVSHTSEDIENLILKIKEVILELKSGSFFEDRNYKLIPATSFQERLYILSQFENMDLTYNQSYGWRVKELNIPKLKEAFETIIDRHESLKTSFIFQNEKLYQKIYTKINFKMEFIETNKINKEIDKFLNIPFELTKLPLFKVLIIKSENEYILLIKNHHIIFDGISFDILINEFKRVYEGDSLLELHKNYSDFTLEYKNFLETKEFQKQKLFWENKFKEFSNIHLPIDKPYPSIRSSIGNSLNFEIDKELTISLKKLAKNLNTTINVILMASFNILLYKLSNSKEIIIGLPVTTRENEYFNVIGMFANTLPLKSQIEANENFSEYIQKLKIEFLEIMENLNYPLESLMENLNIKRDMSKNPLFNVMFVYERANREKLLIDNEEFIKLEIKKSRVDFDLILEVTDEGESLSAKYEYYEIFSEKSIFKWVEYFKNILTTISNIDTTIKEINILSKSERELLSSFNNTNSSYPFKTIVNIFEENVKNWPQNEALIFEEKVLTYFELNERVNEIANYLIEHFEIKNSDLIALIVERSEYLIISILAILKVGGAYVPIDKNYPKEKIEYILNDSKPIAILSDSDIGINVKEIFHPNKSNPNINIDFESLAYVIYTSGTTGEPKGCLITHKNLIMRVKSENLPFEFNESDVWLALHSYSFDFFVWEMYGSLLYGSKLIIAKEPKDINNILNLIKKYRVSVLNQTPAYFYQLSKIAIEKSKNELSEHLRYIIFGGDKLKFEYLKEWVNKYPLNQIKLINMYGITETTIHVTYYEIKESDLNKNRSNIGNALANTKVYILDNNLNFIPFGVEGEMYIGGEGLAKGYLNREKLTNEKFINHPTFGRIYKSGDLAKRDFNGEIEYIGRSDEQVKVRGFRIELGEIEANLKKHPQIIEAIVNVKSEKLVAYYRANEVLSDLKEFLSEKLAEYMVPEHYIKIEVIPLTSNGKVDKERLPKFEIKTTSIAPSNEIEKKLVSIFEDILNVKIGIKDNFFASGGDSIKAIQIISKANKQKLKFSIQDIFKYQTIEELAPKVQYLKTSNEKEKIVGEIDLTPIQKGFFNLELNKNHFNQSIMLKSKEKINLKALNEAFKLIITHHDMLRATFENQKQIIKEECEFEIETLSGNIEKEIHKAQESLNIKNRLFRVLIYENFIYIIIHHLIIDGVSWRILIDDLNEFYQYIKSNKKVISPIKSASYREYSQKLIEYSKSENLLNEVNFWNKIGNSDFSKLTLDKNYIDNFFKDTIEIDLILSNEETQKLKEMSKIQKSRIDEILLLILMQTFNKLMGISKLAITLEAHGREDILNLNLSKTIGWFSSIYPIILTLPNGEINYQLQSIKEELNNIPNSGLGYGVLKYLTNKLNFKLNPEVIFNYLGEFNFEASEFIFLKDRLGDEVASDFKRDALIEIDIIIINEQLKISIRYNTTHFNKSTIDKFLKIYHLKIDEIIKYSSKKESEFNSDNFDYKIDLNDLEGLFNA